jgi:hypothetical protein
MVKRRGLYRVLVGRYEGRRPHGRSRRKREDNIKMDFEGVRQTGLISLRIGICGVFL